jgi:hypothetical protein
MASLMMLHMSSASNSCTEIRKQQATQADLQPEVLTARSVTGLGA